jgi:hypothetical protein
MADIRLTSVIPTYKLLLNSNLYVPLTTSGSATLGANGAANKFFHTFMCSDPDVGVQFFKDVGLIQSSKVCSKCWSEYREFETPDYTHVTVNHLIGFVDVGTGAHTNTIKNTWRHVNAFLNTYNPMAY